MYDCIVIGDITIDTFLVIDDAHLSCTTNKDFCEICFEFGAKIPVHASHQAIGGNAANVAAALHTLGHEIALLSEIGDDVNGKTALSILRQKGIPTDMVKVLKGKDTRYSTIVNFESDRTVFSYHAPRTYTLPRFPDVSWIYYTSLGKSFEQIQKKIIDRKKKKSFRLAVNPGSYQMHKGIRTFRKILPFTDVLFVNLEEAQQLIDQQASPAVCAATLHDIGVDVVVITDGEHGSYASNGDILLHMPIYSGKQISKTGAGDAYASAFLAAHMAEQDLPTCMQWGTANANSVVGKMGAQAGHLHERAIQKLIQANKKATPTPVK